MNGARAALVLAWCFAACGETPESPPGRQVGEVARTIKTPERPDLTRRFELALGPEFDSADELTEGTITVDAPERQSLEGPSGTVDPSLSEGVYPIHVARAVVRFGKGRPVRLDATRLIVEPTILDTTKPGPYRLSLRRRGGSCGIRIRVSTDAASPLADAVVEVFQTSRRRTLEDRIAVLTTSSKGTAFLRGIPAGRYRAVLSAAGRFATPQVVRPNSRQEIRDEFQLRENEVRDVTLTAAGGGAISGVIKGIDMKRTPLRLSLHRRWSDGVWRAVGRRIARDGAKFSIGSLSPGGYLVVMSAQGHEAISVSCNVRLVEETNVVVRAGPPSKRRVSLTMEGEAKAEPLRFNLNRVERMKLDVALGILSPAQTVALDFPIPRPGNYLFLLWDLKWCIPVRIADKDEQELTLPAPRDSIGRGSRTLSVRVMLRGEPVYRLCVCLWPKDGAASMRFGTTNPAARFRDLAAGDYEVLAYDGVFGVAAGFEPNPTRIVVRIDDKDKTIDVPVSRR